MDEKPSVLRKSWLPWIIFVGSLVAIEGYLHLQLRHADLVEALPREYPLYDRYRGLPFFGPIEEIEMKLEEILDPYLFRCMNRLRFDGFIWVWNWVVFPGFKFVYSFINSAVAD